ncbi:MAG: hypothetical protein AMXMBFR84_35380 [Candidatus Hydrogenedentota bacterium]
MRLAVLVTLMNFAMQTVCLGQDTAHYLPISVERFEQDVHRAYTSEHGLPANNVQWIQWDPSMGMLAGTEGGIANFKHDRWVAVPGHENRVSPNRLVLSSAQTEKLTKVAGVPVEIREAATFAGEIAVATSHGLYLWQRRRWNLALPREGSVRWAPVDVRAVAYEPEGALWFASPQGVGRRDLSGAWTLFTATEGLPFNDFTCMASGRDSVWFGTTNGAIRYRSGEWSFRQGRRWLVDNHVHDIAVDDEENAWLATPSGVSCIASQATTLQEKAAFFEAEIEKYHRRTTFGYVNPAILSSPGDKSTAKAEFTDNDGHNTGLYLGAVSLGYSVTRDPEMKTKAANAFRALAFLSEVTQGGTHPAPKGFVARAVRPTSEPDPNPQFDLAYDQKRKAADSLWQIIQPRWPVDESGQWYWKNDSSSDELDGHFFGYAIYYDRVCETEDEKRVVRDVVRRIIDHVIDHGYNMVDFDGLPTRWGHFSPEDLNQNEAWCYERGLNSYSILTYLSIAHHILGDSKYREEYLRLAIEHGYGMNGMTQPKDIAGPGTFGQPDDNMAFVNYYHLIRYETEPKLLSMYYRAINRHWHIEKYERNAFENFIYAACCFGKVRRDQWGETDLTPPRLCFDDAIETLRRYPWDLVDWPMSNAHRIDMVPLGDHLDQKPGTGHRNDGRVYQIDERHEIYWDRDPWVLSNSGTGTRLREGYHYLLAYYLGRAHGFISE